MPTAVFWGFIEKPISPIPSVIRKKLISAPVIWVSGFGRPDMAALVSVSAGISGFLKRPAVLRLMVLKCSSFPPPLVPRGTAQIDSRDHWQRVMQGHAGANIMPLVASNRIGVEKGDNFEMTFYGSSFISDHTGAKVAEANRIDETVLTATFDLDEIRRYREDWGVFRDRRPARYGALMSLDGESF